MTNQKDNLVPPTTTPTANPTTVQRRDKHHWHFYDVYGETLPCGAKQLTQKLKWCCKCSLIQELMKEKA